LGWSVVEHFCQGVRVSFLVFLVIIKLDLDREIQQLMTLEVGGEGGHCCFLDETLISPGRCVKLFAQYSAFLSLNSVECAK